jgi:hypothetical protein
MMGAILELIAGPLTQYNFSLSLFVRYKEAKPAALKPARTLTGRCLVEIRRHLLPAFHNFCRKQPKTSAQSTTMFKNVLEYYGHMGKSGKGDAQLDRI